MNADDLFTAPQVAKICSTDLKTIHNWVNRGEIKSFRTPGRHLRFRREDILEFLGRFGYPVPDGFSLARRRVVVVDGEEGALKSLKRTLSRDFEVEGFTDQIDALLAIGKARPNLILVNADSSPEVLRVVERLATGAAGTQVAVYGDDASKETSARGAGASDFIPTTDGKEIRRRIVTILGR